jgi:hypothetical protein
MHPDGEPARDNTHEDGADGEQHHKRQRRQDAVDAAVVHRLGDVEGGAAPVSAEACVRAGAGAAATKGGLRVASVVGVVVVPTPPS